MVSLSAGLKDFLSPECRNGFRPDFELNFGLGFSAFRQVSLNLSSVMSRIGWLENLPSFAESPVLVEGALSVLSPSSSTLMTRTFRFAPNELILKRLFD